MANILKLLRIIPGIRTVSTAISPGGFDFQNTEDFLFQDGTSFDFN